MKRLPGWLRRGLLVLWGVGLLGCLVLGLLYRKHVILEPGEHLSRSSIESVIAQESPVYYADGRTRLGVFFSREHREHVPYAEIPEAWVQAITSSEDKRYWDHVGVDVWGISRAMVQNVLSGRVVAGGSTLTQQTAKNLYYRPDRSLRSKLQELVNALRLEAHYSKEEILEFYANQFHVSANGRGLGIAARYFFDRDVAELGIQECAFLAGLVKAPARYNPFVGTTPEAREAAQDKAQQRMVLVLGRMLAEGHIDEATHQELSKRPLPFKKGTFRYASSVMLDEVERRLALPPFPQLFLDAGIDNPSTAGIQVVTTLDESIQRAAMYGLQHHLTEVGPLMEGLEAGDFLLDSALAPKPDPNRGLDAHEIRLARVVSQDPAEGVRLDLGGFEGLLDEQSLSRVSGLFAKAEAGNRWAKPTQADRELLMGALSPGAVVRVSIREMLAEGTALCDLEFTPELQGAIIVLEKGRIRAMVGGSRNQDFNRAVAARRQLGSTWKPLLLSAALQLGWAPTDELDNRRAVFPFEGSFYAPNPDHEPEPFVSLGWSSVRSENLASVWLLFHLIDRLDDEQLLRVAGVTDLGPRPGEKRRDYIKRIRDGLGVIATRSRMNAVLFSMVRKEVATDLIFSGVPSLEKELHELASMHYGLGFSKERSAVEAWTPGTDRARRLQAMESSFLHLEKQVERCRESIEPRDPAGSSGLAGASFSVVENEGGERSYFCGRAPTGAVPLESFQENELELGGLEQELADKSNHEAPGKPEMELDSQVAGPTGLRVPPEDFLVDGRVHASTLSALRTAINAARPAVSDLDPYDLKALVHHPDFRVLLGVRYLAVLAQRLGVDGPIPPVLSLPLGAVDVSIEEMAGVYQGMLTGQVWRFPGEAFDSGSVAGFRSSRPLEEIGESHLLIQEIRDRHGNVMYRADEVVEEVVDSVAGVLVEDVLGNVVRHGTARRSASVLRGIDAGGKTGTTNGFRNSAFVGYARGETRSFVVSSYVGYDDNRSMVRGNSKLHGASGALPAWTLTVKGMVDAGIIEVDQDFQRSGFRRVSVEPSSGLVVDKALDTGPSMRVSSVGGGGSSERRFVPLLNETGAFRGSSSGAEQSSIWDDIVSSSE